MLFIGNTEERTMATSVRITCALSGKYRLRLYDSLIGEWEQRDELFTPDRMERGITIKLERKGFCLLDLAQEV